MELLTALAPFPLNSIISTMQIQINNNNISMQVAEILPMLLRLYDPETLAKYDSLTPTTLDQLADYADAVQKLIYTVAGGAASGDAVKTMLPSSCSSKFR
jgi:tripartite-type tricarboxylate transporter receptor subunit TctC